MSKYLADWLVLVLMVLTPNPWPSDKSYTTPSGDRWVASREIVDNTCRFNRIRYRHRDSNLTYNVEITLNDRGGLTVEIQYRAWVLVDGIDDDQIKYHTYVIREND